MDLFLIAVIYNKKANSKKKTYEFHSDEFCVCDVGFGKNAIARIYLFFFFLSILVLQVEI